MKIQPLSIPKQLDKLDKRMQRIEDAITAKGIKFVDVKKEYDWIPASKVMDYVYELIGIQRNRRQVYKWIHSGLIDSQGKRIRLECKAIIAGKFLVRKLWVRTFLDKMEKEVI